MGLEEDFGDLLRLAGEMVRGEEGEGWGQLS